MDNQNQKQGHGTSCPTPMPEAAGKIRTGIFGGSFNPVHNGHVELARRLLNAAGLDEVWFVVSPQNPLKRQEDLLDDDLRLQMARMALEGEARMKASDYEFHMPKPSYMWHTLRSLSADYPGREFILLIGADNWAGFSQWYEWRNILNNYNIVVYPRSGSPVDTSSLPANVHFIDTGLLDISSTEIRRRIKAGEPFGGMVPPKVEAFILSEGLYK